MTNTCFISTVNKETHTIQLHQNTFSTLCTWRTTTGRLPTYQMASYLLCCFCRTHIQIICKYRGFFRNIIDLDHHYLIKHARSYVSDSMYILCKCNNIGDYLALSVHYYEVRKKYTFNKKVSYYPINTKSRVYSFCSNLNFC